MVVAMGRVVYADCNLEPMMKKEKHNGLEEV